MTVTEDRIRNTDTRMLTWELLALETKNRRNSNQMKMIRAELERREEKEES